MKCAAKILAVFITLSATAELWAQQVYPVSGNSVLIPPYSVYLSDYTEGTSDRILLNILLRDAARPELPVRLRIKIIGQNITLETKEEFHGKEFILQGGIQLRLTGIDLAEYFDPNNLNFSGISKREFERTGALPQGFYQFCFEVLEVNREVVISNAICGNGWLILNDPPIINLPSSGDKLVPTQPQNIVFQWTPRHTGSPNSAFSTEYDIKLVELWPVNRNPNDAILTSPPILEESTRNTTFIYDVSKTPLEPGRHYALQVRAKSIVGVEELDLFKNNGKSEVITFVYGDACNIPQSILAEATSATRFTVKWTGEFNHTGYSVRYRLANNQNAPWYTSKSLVPDIGINGLQPNTMYEFQVAGGCGAFESQYSSTARIKTLDTSEQGYSCGAPLEQYNLDPANLLDALKTGDVIQAGDFDVRITKASGFGGTFSGEGVIEVPFFNRASVKAEFANVVVTRERRMVNGYMNVTGAGLQIIPSGILNLMDQLDETLVMLDTALTNIENNRPQPFDPHAFVPDVTFNLPGPVIVYKEPDGTVVITDGDGTEHRLPPGTEAAIVDDQGNGTLIDSQGKAHSVSGAVATAAINREYNLKLLFTEAKINHQFGFDAVADNAPEALKKRYKNLKDNYYAPYKSVEVGVSDLVVGLLEDNTIDKNKIRFEMGGVPVLASPFSGSEATVTVSSKSDGEEEALIAILSAQTGGDKDQVLGRVNVVSYSQINKIVHIIPVNGNAYKQGTAETLQVELNKIYKQAVVTWSVVLDPGIQVEGINPFNVGETGMLTNYTDHMKQVINAYKANMEKNDNTYYLFLVSSPSNSTTQGFMPRSKQAGFIFTDNHNSESAIARTVAHELGHGAFNLHHTFMEEDFSLPKGATDNLMDYADGTTLYKYQWDKMRSPAIVLELFEGDDEAFNLINANVPTGLANSDSTFNFITPTGKKITLPINIIADFRYGIVNPVYHTSPIGYLNSFKILEKNKIIHYVSRFSGSLFRGYYSIEKNEYYHDKLTSNNTFLNVILFVPDALGYRFISYKSDVEPYKNDEESLTYNDFPIKPYYSGEVERSSKHLLYAGIYNLTASENEQWTINPEVFETLLKPFNGNPEHYFLLKIVELATAYDELFLDFTSCWNDWATLASPQKECRGYWEKNILANNRELWGKWKTSPAEFYEAFTKEFITFINDKRIEAKNLFDGSIVEKWNAEPYKLGFRLKLLDALNSMSNESVASLVSCENRIVSIAILNWVETTESFEKEIIRLINYTPESQIDCFLKGLKQESPIDSVSRIIFKLNKDIHDSHLWIGKDNFKELNKSIWKLVLKSKKYTDEYYLSKIDGQKTIYFYDASFWARVKQSLGAYYGIHTVLAESVVDLNDDCSVELSQATVTYGFNDSYSISQKWDPFTLLSVVNNSRLSILDDLIGNSKTVMPAIMLEYMDWKGSEEFTIDALNAFLDIASTASGIGNAAHLRHLGKLQRAAVVLDMTAGLAGISAGLFEEQIKDIPELQACVNLIQIASGVTSLRAAFKKSNNPSALIETISEASAGGQIDKVKSALDEIEKSVDVLRYINSKMHDGFLQKVETYAFIKKVKTDALIDPSTHSATLAQIKRIESRAGSIEDLTRLLNSQASDLIASLVKPVQSSFDKLIENGLQAELKGNSVRLIDRSNEVVAIIYDGKLRPTKWGWTYKYPKATHTQTAEGYIIIKDGDNVRIDLGFKEGRILEAKEVNDYLVHGQGKDIDGQPYWAGTYVEDIILGRKGEWIYFVEDFNDGVPRPGQFGSRDPVYTIEELRRDLAVKESWKKPENKPTLRIYKVKADLKVRSGIIGRQSENGKELIGGGHQYEATSNYLRDDWEKLLEPTGPRSGIKLDNGGNYIFGVDDLVKDQDALAGVLVNGGYLLNPTSKNVSNLIKNTSGVMKLDQSSGSILNGQYMYVITANDEILIGTRAPGISPFNGKAPHPTLIGGTNPTVRVAGTIEFRGGKIYKIDNISGHFKPSTQALENAEAVFYRKFDHTSFANDFQGYIAFTN